jgi:hypothetical protein
MTQFVKEQFTVDREYVHYDGKFVARFKHKPGSKASFVSFLIKNFTVEEYFAAMASGLAPLQIVNDKGYIQPHIRKWLKEAGLPLTREGVAMLLAKSF